MTTAIADRLTRFCTPTPRPARVCVSCGAAYHDPERLTCSDICAAKLDRTIRACEARRAADAYADYRAGLIDPRD